MLRDGNPSGGIVEPTMAHMKSPLGMLEQAWMALFKDAGNAYPDLRTDLAKDFETLSNGLKTKGLHLAMVVLPDVDKHFCRCLARRAYLVSGLPLTKRVSRHIQVPAFLRGLYLRVFDRLGRLLPSPDIEAIIFIRQIYCLAKKVAIDCPTEKKTAAIADFVSVDSSNPEPSWFWNQDALGVPDALRVARFCDLDSSSANDSKCLEGSPTRLDYPWKTIWAVADTVSAILVSELGSFVPELGDYKHGPGVVSNIPGFSSKYKWKDWDTRLDREFPVSDCGYHNHREWAAGTTHHVALEAPPPSRMYCVPKTFKGPRLIAAEPTEHMWCQQGVWRHIETRSRDSLIGLFCRFRDQSLNQSLARKGSKDDSLVTVDLSAASDRVSCDLVQAVFRGNPTLLLALQASRTTHVDLTKCREAAGIHKLRMFSTMGNACTFPVESICFLTLAITAVLVTRGLKPSRKTIESLTGELAVFGDDIIAPKDSWELLREVLTRRGLVINQSKTFSEGNFRESCGCDAYAGVDVTPVYLKHFQVRGPESVLGTTETGNRAHMRGYFHLSAFLRGMVAKKIKLPAIPTDSGLVGHKLFTVKGVRAPRRLNLDLQRVEVRLIQPTGRVRRARHDGMFNLLQYFVEAPGPLTKWESGYQIEPAVVSLSPRWVAEDLCIQQEITKQRVL